MVKTYEIESFENIVEIGSTMGKNWFRGHSKIYNQLLPGIFRGQYKSPMHEMFKPQYEAEIVYQFKRYAPTIIKQVPEEFDFLTWLFWIQHYGMPTRLLDWTENIFVATFFCVINNQDKDGEIWTMYPDELNSHSGFFSLALTNHKVVKYLSGEPFHTHPNVLQKELGLSESPKFPVAFNPPRIFQRINAQHGTFTIHPNPKKGTLQIEEALTDEKDITRYIIPKELKSDFEKKLSYLGFNYRTLFPDFEGLTKYFVREERYFGWRQPKPPKFKIYEDE